MQTLENKCNDFVINMSVKAKYIGGLNLLILKKKFQKDRINGEAH